MSRAVKLLLVSNRYDHHQRGFEETLDAEHETKLSSAGLIYKHFGREVVAKQSGISQEDPTLEVIYQRLYTIFVEGIDGIDNGVQRYPAEIAAKYQENTNLAARVGRLNPAWNEEGVDEAAQFRKAVAIAGEEFESMLKSVAKQWLPARTIVEDALNKRESVLPGGEVMVFSSGGCPWKDHLVTLEAERKIEGQIKFVLYQDQSGKWRIQTVPLTPGSFAFRKSILKEWCGLRDEELSAKSGISDCIFVHANGFIGGNQTYDGCLEMAKRSLAA